MPESAPNQASQHTPGPWAYDKESGDIESTVDGSLVCNVYESDETAADAALIAAAPELLAAAKTVLDGLDARIEAAPHHAVPVFDGIADLHTAIAKAEAR